jgi:hypothetical protein
VAHYVRKPTKDETPETRYVNVRRIEKGGTKTAKDHSEIAF